MFWFVGRRVQLWFAKIERCVLMDFKEEENQLGFIEAAPKPSLNELDKFYKEKYYQTSQGIYQSSYDEGELQLFSNIARLAKTSVVRYGLSTQSLLDIGCGEGFFSSYFAAEGWNISCCDFSDFGVKKFNPSLLPYFKQGDAFDFLKESANANHKFGLVNFSNVLEHVLDPVEFLTKVAALIDSESIVRCDVPNDYSDFQKLLLDKGLTKNTWFLPPQHLSYFNTKNISAIFDACGLRIVSMQTSFPIEVFIANEHSNYANNKGFGKGAHRARVLCVNHLIDTDIDTYVDYSENAAKLGFGRDLVVYAKKA